jgi:tRNA threonylcarbamoyladenosine biosynthesis protein TsaE
LSGRGRRLTSESAAETEGIGAEIAAELEPGDVVLVSGELGAGKTTLIRGACRRLGVTEPVTSPTFTIGVRYRGRVAVSHLDLYRLDALDVEEPGLLDDYLTPDAIAFVEWPAAGGAALDAAVSVEIAHAGGDRRRISVAARR